MHASAEIPLLLFTLLAQMSIGIVFAGQIALAGNNDLPLRGRLRGQNLFAFAFMALAALLSAFHLGTPIHAPFTIFHIGSSWLSREIFMVLLTGAALAWLAYLIWRKPDSQKINLLAMGSCALGVLLIYTMSRVYNSPFLPGWSGGSIFFMFLATSLILGSLWQACALGTARRAEESRADKTALWRVFFLAVAGFVLLAICLPLSTPIPAPGINPLSQEATAAGVATFQGWRALLSGLGILLFLIALRRGMKGRPIAAILILALLFAIVGEIAGRYGFYMSYARLGM